ncbi:hypothetical protein QR680_010314 [Steinernema hermaphroditum]|uniref:Uncharacterized protein n=1 Tax=Steinernema hermaphroditum TaxID=289476 RepID=A0AA39MBC3_9BILA|nr:hypothetical protein QR680_010314 [Steinernema hermaphroditum]
MRTFGSENISVPISISRIGFHSGSPLGLADCSPFAYSPPGILTRCDAKDLCISLNFGPSTSTGSRKRVKERCPICTAVTRLMCSKCVTNRVKYSSSYVNYKQTAERNDQLLERFNDEVKGDERLNGELDAVKDRILEHKSRLELLEARIEEKKKSIDLLKKKLAKSQHVWINVEEGQRVVTKSLSERPRITQQIVNERRRLLVSKRKKIAGQLFVWIFPILKISVSMLESIKETKRNSWQLINSDDPCGSDPLLMENEDNLYSISGCVINEHFCFESLHRSLTPRDALVLDRTNCHVFAGLNLLAQLVHLLLLLFAVPAPVDLKPNQLFTQPTFTKTLLSELIFSLKVAAVLVCVSQRVPLEKIDLGHPVRNLLRLYEKICDDMAKRTPSTQEVLIRLPEDLKKEINDLKDALTSSESSDVLVLEDWVAL